MFILSLILRGKSSLSVYRHSIIRKEKLKFRTVKESANICKPYEDAKSYICFSSESSMVDSQLASLCHHSSK